MVAGERGRTAQRGRGQGRPFGVPGSAGGTRGPICVLLCAPGEWPNTPLPTRPAGNHSTFVLSQENAKLNEITQLSFTAKKPLVDPPEQTVQRGHPSRIRCWVPGDPRAQLRWSMRGNRPLPPGARDDGRGNLDIQRTLEEHEGEYECTAAFPHEAARSPQANNLGNKLGKELCVNLCLFLGFQVSEPALINVNPPPETPPEAVPQGKPPAPVATPPQQTVPRGEPARFHCEPNSETPAQIHWGKWQCTQRHTQTSLFSL
jgi:hypothetical protein